MDEEQVKLANDNYNILYRFSDEYYRMYKEDIDKTNDFYKYYVDLYTDVEREKSLNGEGNSNDSLFNIPYKPFEELNNIAQNDCVKDKDLDKLNLFNQGDASTYKNLDGLSYKENFHFYKTMDGFYTEEDEQKYIIANKNIPFWFSSPYLAYLAIPRRNGGMNAYKVKQAVNVLIINCENIKKIIQLVKENESDKMLFRNTTHYKENILDLLRLSSCSEKGFIHQLSIYNKFNKYNDEIWLTKNALTKDNTKPCNLKIDNNDYFGIIKQKGKNNYNFAYLLSYLNDKYWNKYYDAYVITQKYTPYFFSGITLEEFVFFDPYRKLERDTNNKYDWYQYKDYLDFKIHNNFRVPRLFSEYNTNFNLYKFYDQYYMSDKNKQLKTLSEGKISVIYLDVNNFKSINTNDNYNEIKTTLDKFIKFMNADVYLLLNAPNYKINNYESIIEGKLSFFYKNRNIKNNIKVLFSNISLPFSYPYKRPFFQDFKTIAIKNYDNVIKQFDAILNKSPHIIFIKGKLTYNSPEFKYLHEKGFNTTQLKNSIYPNDHDYVFTNKKFVKIDTLNYNMSYYRPIIVII
jgi:hypothetical protein